MYQKIERLIDITIRVMLLIEVLLKNLGWALIVRPKGVGKRVQIKEEGSGMAKVFTYNQQLLPAHSGVDQQRIVVSVDGTDQEPQLLLADATEFVFKVGPEGANVKLTLDYLDAAGNDSANFEDTFIVADEIPPDAPIGFGARTEIAEEEV